MAIYNFNWGQRLSPPNDLTLEQFNNNSFYKPLLNPTFKLQNSFINRGYTAQTLFDSWVLEAIQWINIYTQYAVEKLYNFWEDIPNGERTLLIKIIFSIIEYWQINGGCLERNIDISFVGSQNQSISVNNIPYATWKEVLGTKATNLLMGTNFTKQLYVKECKTTVKQCNCAELKNQVDANTLSIQSLNNQISKLSPLLNTTILYNDTFNTQKQVKLIDIGRLELGTPIELTGYVETMLGNFNDSVLNINNINFWNPNLATTPKDGVEAINFLELEAPILSITIGNEVTTVNSVQLSQGGSSSNVIITLNNKDNIDFINEINNKVIDLTTLINNLNNIKILSYFENNAKLTSFENLKIIEFSKTLAKDQFPQGSSSVILSPSDIILDGLVTEVTGTNGIDVNITNFSVENEDEQEN